MHTEKPAGLRFNCPCGVGFDHQISFQALCLMECEMDAKFNKAIQELRQTRDAMTKIKVALMHTDYGNELTSMSLAARKSTQQTMFRVRRYYDVKEEAIRLKRQWELTKLKYKKHSLFVYYAKRALLAFEYGVKTRVTQNNSHRDKQLQRLQEGMDKVEMHRLLLLVGDVGIPA